MSFFASTIVIPVYFNGNMFSRDNMTAIIIRANNNVRCEGKMMFTCMNLFAPGLFSTPDTPLLVVTMGLRACSCHIRGLSYVSLLRRPRLCRVRDFEHWTRRTAHAGQIYSHIRLPCNGPC